jgi:membrane fusion protein
LADPFLILVRFLLLFRSEAILYRGDRLSGDVAIAVPLPWQSIGFLIFGGVALSVLFLSLASYSRVETVTGIITPNTGVSNIVPTRAGMIASLAVRDGQNVPAGAALATIRAEEDGAAAQSPAALVQSAIDRQDASLAAQSDAALAAAQAQGAQLAAQRSGLVAEMVQLQSQITTQEALIASAQKDLDRNYGDSALNSSQNYGGITATVHLILLKVRQARINSTVRRPQHHRNSIPFRLSIPRRVAEQKPYVTA